LFFFTCFLLCFVHLTMAGPTDDDEHTPPFVGSWLWHSDKIDSMPEVVLDWFGKLVVVKRVKDKMVNTAGGDGSISWCG
jgi:hypothetical protein